MSKITKSKTCRVARIAVLFGAASLIALAPAQQSLAVRPLQRLRQSFDSIRPGWIIPHSSESSNQRETPEAKRQTVSPQAKKTQTKKTQTKKTQTKKTQTKKPQVKKQQTQKTEAGTDNSPTMADTPEPREIPMPSAADMPEEVAALQKEAPTEFGATLRSTEEDGALSIVELAPNGAALAAGLRVGDIIESVGGISVGSIETMKSIVKSLDNGVVVEFEIVRDGEKEKKDVQFGTYRPSDTEPHAAKQQPGSDPSQASPLSLKLEVPARVETDSLAIVPTPNLIERSNLRSVLTAPNSTAPKPVSTLSQQPAIGSPAVEHDSPASLIDLRPKTLDHDKVQVEVEAAEPELSSPDSLNGLLDLDFSEAE